MAIKSKIPEDELFSLERRNIEEVIKYFYPESIFMGSKQKIINELDKLFGDEITNGYTDLKIKISGGHSYDEYCECELVGSRKETDEEYDERCRTIIDKIEKKIEKGKKNKEKMTKSTETITKKLKEDEEKLKILKERYFIF